VQIKTKLENNIPKILWQKNMQITARKFKPGADREQQPAAQSNDALGAILSQLADGQNRIIEALAQRPEPPPVPSTIEIAKDLAALKDLFADKTPDMMQQMRDFMELKNMLAEETGPSDPLTSAIKHFGPLIASGVEEMQKREVQAVRPPAPPPIPKPLTPEPPSSGASEAELDAYEQSINAHDTKAEAEAEAPTVQEVDAAFQLFATQYLPALKHLVENNAKPAAVAEWVVRHVDGDVRVIRSLGLVIGDDRMVERIVGFDGEMLAHAAWLDAVADWLAHALWPDLNAAPDPDSAPDVSDATEIATNGESGESGTIIDAEPSADSDQESPCDVDATPPGTGDDNDA
jgi:hypothetical protein